MILLGILKLFATSLFLATGWKGSYIFPIMFAGVALGMAGKLLFPDVPTAVTVGATLAGAGMLFSALLITGLVLIRISVPAKPQDAGAWLSENWTRVSLALNLVPFAGVAFLWLIGVVRDRLGDSEDRFFATVFLGSGLLFLGMLFTSAAIAGGMIAMFGANQNELIETGVYRFGRTVTYQIMTVYTMKMAGVFVLSTCTLSLRTGIFPRRMALLGITLALFLLLSVNSFYWAPLVFPLWMLRISGHILLANFRETSNGPAIAALP